MTYERVFGKIAEQKKRILGVVHLELSLTVAQREECRLQRINLIPREKTTNDIKRKWEAIREEVKNAFLIVRLC